MRISDWSSDVCSSDLYCGAAPAPAELLARWNVDPVLLATLVAAALAGGHALRSYPARRRSFLAAIALLAVLFISPFCALTSALFSARVVHHVLLPACAAPLLAAAIDAGRDRLPGGLEIGSAHVCPPATTQHAVC